MRNQQTSRPKLRSKLRINDVNCYFFTEYVASILSFRLENDYSALRKNYEGVNSKLKMLLANLKRKEKECIEILQENEVICEEKAKLEQQLQKQESLEDELAASRKKITKLTEVSQENVHARCRFLVLCASVLVREECSKNF